MPIRQIADTHTNVNTAGIGPKRAVFIHCALAHHGAGSAVMGELAQDYTIHAFDMPGHGRSAGWDGTQDYQQLVANIAAGLCPKPTHVIGHSFGATAALRLACDRPDVVAKLTLIEPVFFAAARAAGDPEYDLHEASCAPFRAAMEVGDREGAARVFTQVWGTGETWEDIPSAQRQYIIDRIHLIVAGSPSIHEDNANLLCSGALEALTCPVTLVEGSQSPSIIRAVHSALCGRIPHAQREVIFGAGHMAPITHPKQVAAAICG